MIALAGRARDRFLIALLACTGLRIGEALGLRRGDMHLLASSRVLGCGADGTHLHVRRRTDNPNGCAGRPGRRGRPTDPRRHRAAGARPARRARHPSLRLTATSGAVMCLTCVQEPHQLGENHAQQTRRRSHQATRPPGPTMSQVGRPPHGAGQHGPDEWLRCPRTTQFAGGRQGRSPKDW